MFKLLPLFLTLISVTAFADLSTYQKKCKRRLEPEAPIYEQLSFEDQRSRLTPVLIRKALRALGEAGYSLQTNNREELKDPIAKKVIGRAIGFEMHPRKLLEAAVDVFGSMQEALWTKTEVRAALKALYKKGYRPNSRFFKYTKSTSELLKIIREAVGFPCEFYSVFSQAKRLYNGDFKAAMADAGLPVEKLYHVRPSQPWTKPLVYKALNALFEAGFRPKTYFLQTSKDPVALQIVIDAVGFKTTLSSLMNFAKDLHDGEFEAALIGAKLPLDEVYELEPRTPWTKTSVADGLRALYREGFLPNASFLQRSKDVEALKVLSEAIGFEAPLSSLYIKAIQFYGSFQKALIGAELPYEQIVGRFEPGDWKPALVHKALRALYENGYAPKYLRRDLPEIEKIVTDAVGFSVKPSTVYWYALYFHDQDMEQALAAAKLPVEEIVSHLKHEKVSRGQIRAGLKALFMNQIFPSSNLFLSKNAEATRVLRRALGSPVSLRAFYDDTLEEYEGRMLNALRDADLPVYRIVQRWHASRILMVMTTWLEREQPRKDGSLRKSYIVRCLRRLYEAGIIYNGPVAESESESIIEILTNMFGRRVSSRYLFDEATRAFGSFRNALIAAGLPAEDIILHHNTTVDPWALTPLQVERVWEKNQRGETVAKKMIGAAAISPEDIVLAREVEQEFIKCLPISLRADGSKILSIVMVTDADSDVGLSEKIRQTAALEGISPARVEAIYNYVRKNQSFKKFLSDDF